MITTLLVVSCQKEDLFEFREQSAITIILPDTLPHIVPINPIIQNETEIILGDQLENPYSVENMRNAYVTRSQDFIDAGLDEDEITTTHFYVKFKPDDESELQLIKQRYINQDIYEYPLDYEISGRTSYHDPSLPDTVPTYQYMAIDSLSWNVITRPENVDYEVLERLYIPDEDLDINISSCAMFTGTMSYIEAIETLVNTSMALTGNLEDDMTDENGVMSSGNKWYPSGRITAYDDIVDGQVPLQGVKIRARRWFTTHTAITDEDGYFTCSKGFKHPANYSIVWEGSMWDIRDDYMVQAYYNGPKIEGAWNLAIPNNNNKSLRFATIHRAAYRMMEGDTYGLSRPTTRQKIAYLHRDGSDNGTYYCEIGLGVFCDIRILGKDNNGWRSVHHLISTTFHELGHAAHFTNSPIQFPLMRGYLRESWASFVGYYLVINEYQELGFYSGPFEMGSYESDDPNIFVSYPYYVPDNRINYQLCEVDGNTLYTPFFIDLYDIQNQYISNVKYDATNASTQEYYPYDEIKNLPIDVLEDIAYTELSTTYIRNYLIDYFNTTLGGSNNNQNLSIDTINNFFELYEAYY